jgi:putative hemolysin
MITAISVWFALFTALAMFHAAEIAVTTLYPWKVREFAEEEVQQGKTRGTFSVLNEDITRVLTTILVTSTMCSIYATTLFTQFVGSVFGHRGERWGAIGLTAITLFFVELLPKSIGVTNAESVARLMVPPINMLANIVSPLGNCLSFLAKKTLLLFGLKGKDSGGVSDSELRLIVTGARDSGTIEHTESEMIKGVLNLQDQRVKELMRPRVEMVAVPKDMSVASVLGVVRDSGYSRIPIYDGEIDNIVGIVLAKSVLDYFVQGVLVQGDYRGRDRDSDVDVDGDGNEVEIAPVSSGNAGYVRALTVRELASRMEQTIGDADLIESCYFVPDTAKVSASTVWL